MFLRFIREFCNQISFNFFNFSIDFCSIFQLKVLYSFFQLFVFLVNLIVFLFDLLEVEFSVGKFRGNFLNFGKIEGLHFIDAVEDSGLTEAWSLSFCVVFFLCFLMFAVFGSRKIVKGYFGPIIALLVSGSQVFSLWWVNLWHLEIGSITRIFTDQHRQLILDAAHKIVHLIIPKTTVIVVCDVLRLLHGWSTVDWYGLGVGWLAVVHWTWNFFENQNIRLYTILVTEDWLIINYFFNICYSFC